jgi:hypothetical protein
MYVLRRAGDLIPLERERMALVLGERQWTPGQISRRVMVDCIAWVEATLSDIRSLPLGDEQTFFGDGRNVWTAESVIPLP